MSEILLLQPPALKPAEPPLGLAVLLAHLRSCGLKATALDANLEAYLYLLDPVSLAAHTQAGRNTSLNRALNHRDASLALLRSQAASQNFARYTTAVRYLNQLLGCWGSPKGEERLTLGDYRHDGLSPFDPADLERLAKGQVSTLFADYFTAELVPRIRGLAPRTIAISINYLHQALPAFELAGLLRRALPQVKLVGGGGLISSWREPVQRLGLRLPPFDHLVFGPGEGPLAQLARAKSLNPICSPTLRRSISAPISVLRGWANIFRRSWCCLWVAPAAAIGKTASSAPKPQRRCIPLPPSTRTSCRNSCASWQPPMGVAPFS